LPTKTLLLENAKQMHNILYPASASSTRKHSSNIKTQHDSSKPLHEFTAGSKVMLCKPPRSPKSLPEYSGPFTVIRRNHGGAYLLQDSTGVTLPDKFSPNQLKLGAPPEDSVGKITNTYLKTPHVGSVPDPQLFFLLYPPILPFSSFPFLSVYFEAMSEIHSRCPSSILLNTLLVSSLTLLFLRLYSTNNSTNELPPDEYEIDEILDHKGPANKCEYFVHWKGYPHSDNQWIPAKDVHAPKLIKCYWDLLKQSSSSSTCLGQLTTKYFTCIPLVK
ncbi:Chromo domain-containing protein, partial [Balamuthia mandrillaris]